MTRSFRRQFPELFMEINLPTKPVIQNSELENPNLLKQASRLCPSLVIGRYQGILCEVLPLLNSQPNCHFQTVSQVLQTIDRTSEFLPLNIPEEIRRFKNTVLKVRKRINSLGSDSVKRIDEDLLGNRSELMQKVLEYEKVESPEGINDKNIDLFNANLNKLNECARVITTIKESIKSERVNILPDVIKNANPFMSKDLEPLLLAYSTMYQCFNGQHLNVYGQYISLVTASSIPINKIKESIFSLENKKSLSIEALNSEMDKFELKIQSKKIELKKYIDYTIRRIDNKRSNLLNEFSKLSAEFTDFKFYLGVAKCTKTAIESEEHLTKLHLEKMNEKSELDLEFEIFELRCRRSCRSLSDHDYRKFNELKEYILNIAEDITKIRCRLLHIAYYMPEIILKNPIINPFFGTAAAGIPLRFFGQRPSFNWITYGGKKVVNRKFRGDLQEVFQKMRIWGDLQKLPDISRIITCTGIGIFSSLVDEVEIYLEMPLFPKGNIRKWMEKNSERSEILRLATIRDIAIALNFLHDSDIIHRNIKVENILISDEDIPTLTDLDFAIKINQNSNAEQEKSSQDLLESEGKVFVDAYSKMPSSKASDCFALGIVASEVILGRAISSVEEIPTDASRLVKTLLHGLLEPDHIKRWTLHDVLQSLRSRCSICLEYICEENMIRCNVRDNSLEFHVICRDPCFNKYILSLCDSSDAENNLCLINGEIPCVAGKMSCEFTFSDQDIISNCSDLTSSAFLKMKYQLQEKKIIHRLDKEYEDRLQKQLASFAKMDAFQREVKIYELHALELFNLHCPRCYQVFLDFEGCFALQCSRCSCAFCAWCLNDCGDDAHSHVASCDMNITEGKEVYGSIAAWQSVRDQDLQSMLEVQLMSISNPRIREKVFESIEGLLKERGIHLDF